MAKPSDLTLKDRLWYHRYRFRKVDPLPWQPPRQPLAQGTVAVVTSAGIHLPSDPPFQRVKGGDYSFRVIPGDAPLSSLVLSHPSSAWDRSGVEADANMALPLDRLQEMVTGGEIGGVAPRHVSIQGSITAPMRLMKESGPEMARIMADDGVDLVLLTPV
jgi:D-proline reductase (dithiol) PrdB